MKKRDRPLVGDSPARIRVPLVGTVSLGGVVAVANGRCGIPRNQVRGRLRRGVGGRGMEARRGSGRRRQRPQCGVLPGGTERPFKQAQEGGDPGSKQSIEAPRLPYGSSTVACATTAPGHSPVRAEGKPSPRASAPAGCAGRPTCRAASASPGPPHPPASRRLRWAPGRQPCPCPGCRPQPPGRRTAASPGPSTRRRPTEPDAAQPSSCPCRRGPPAHLRRHPSA